VVAVSFEFLETRGFVITNQVESTFVGISLYEPCNLIVTLCFVLTEFDV
jgi:hypothetical protein